MKAGGAAAGSAGGRLHRILKRALVAALAVPSAVAIPIACSSEPVASTQTGSSQAGAAGAAGGGAAGASTAGAAGSPSDGGVEASPCDSFEFQPPPDAADDCGIFYRLPCGLDPSIRPGLDCYLSPNDCPTICGQIAFSCHAVFESCIDGGIVKDQDGGVEIDCTICPGGIGRVPAGLMRPGRAPATSALGAHFARSAHLEAASVHAFRRLRRELSAHRAPASLRRAAQRAERDEVRHARLCGRMARRFGGAPPPARVLAVPVRALDVIAIENAVEGCVRETFGAAVAGYQAENAADPEIACVMRGIARDEARHAALSWAAFRWALPRLGGEARARLDERCRAAVAALADEASAAVAPPEVAAAAGVPGAAQCRALLDVLKEQLWREWA